MIVRRMTAEDRRRLNAGSERRERISLPGTLREGELREDHRALRNEWASFLGRFPLDTFFTLTYSDRYAQKHMLYAMTSALNDFERWVDRIGFRGQYLVAAEPHFDRDVPHLHGLIESRALLRTVGYAELGEMLVTELAPMEQGEAMTALWRSWFGERGRAKFEAPRSDAAVFYCSKYSLKEANPDTVRFRLKQVKGNRRNAGRGCS